jgi:class 3 adenylate cyclase
MAATNVQALVLVYDIRGFTAASKRVGTADLGAFATAAHREILDLFAACPPSFLKNLGDGHLLVWETPGALDPGLLDQVLAAARRAPVAFASFVAGQGALGSRLPKQVGIGIAYGETFKSDDYYGVTMNLAARLQNEARPEGLALSETVFDAAARRDERLKAEFQRARVGLKGLGSTVIWVKRPFSLKRVLRPFIPWAVAVGIPLVYVALSDAGLRLPVSEPIRRFLDARGATLFRIPRDEAEVRASAGEWRGKYLDFFDRIREPKGWIRGSVDSQEEKQVDVWTSSQALAAIFRAPGVPAERLSRAVGDLGAAFGPHTAFIEQDGVAFGWPAHAGSDYTEAEPALWTVAAIALALARKDVVPDAERPKWLDRLRLAQRASDLHHPLGDGGWNMFPYQEDAARHSPYSSALALLALLEVHAAGLPWADGGTARTQELLRTTATWLASRFDANAPVPGWRGTPFVHDRVSSGLTLQLYAELLRAESQAGVAVPPGVLASIPRHLEDLGGKALKEAYDAGENTIRFQGHRDRAESARTGKTAWTTGTESVNFLWHPWAIEAGWRWLDRANRLGGADPADVQRARRTLGHLVVDLADDAFKEATSGYTFVASETLYGLSSIK